jgi:hypothetical protein
MPRGSGALRLAIGALLVASPGAALAADAGAGRAPAATSAAPRASAAPSASASSAASAGPASSAAPGALPAGHPDLDDGNPHAHAGGGGGAPPGMFEPPPDTQEPEPGAPPGTITVELRDADEAPVAGEELTLGILVNSVAKGDSRKHLQAATDARGRAVFSNLETASNIAYRVSSGYQGGAFAATPFQLQQAKAMHVVLHVYPVVRDIQQALVVAEAAVACEIREDRIQVEEALTIYNLGRTAWQPLDTHMTLPEGFTAFNAQASMSDQGVDDDKGRARLHGTFPPGRHAVEFRWQLPWSGDKDVDFEVGMPPHVAIARVMMPATSDIKLAASGFPPAEVRHDQQGQSFLVTERRLRPDEPKLTSLSVGIHDLPTQGPGRLVATLVAMAAIVLGFVLAFTGRGPQRGRGQPSSRDAILEELAELERAHTAGEIGPKTYERGRRELIVALARTLSPA